MSVRKLALRVMSISVLGLVFFTTHPIASAISPTTVPTELQYLLQDPNTKVIVHDSTVAAQLSPTLAPVLINPTMAMDTHYTITVEIPIEGSMTVVNNIIFSGKGPPDTIITVHIHDDDFSDPLEKHQPSIHTIGTTTSDKQGIWVFAPPEPLSLGRYQVWAYYNDPAKGTIQSTQIHFVVENAFGVSREVYFWYSYQFWLLILLIAVIIVAVIFFIRKRAGKKLPPLNIFSQKIAIQPIPQLQEQPVQEQPQIPIQEQTHVSAIVDKIPSIFLTPEEILALQQRQIQKNEDQKEKFAALQKELQEVKARLATTARDVAVAGQTTEVIEKELETEAEGVPQEPKKAVVRQKAKKKKRS